MKTILALFLTCLPLCAATTYPMLSTTTARTVEGGITNLPHLNSNNVFTGTARFTGAATITNTASVFAGNGAGLTGIVASAYLPLAGGTVSGVVTFNSNISLDKDGVGASAIFSIDADAAQESAIYFQKDNSLKWEQYVPGGASDLAFYDGTAGTEAFRLVAGGRVQGRVGTSTSTFGVGGVIFAQTTTNSTTNVDGTEDDLYSVTLAANTFSADNQSVVQVEHINLAAHATATRVVRKYLSGTEIWDSGTLTLAGGADVTLTTQVMRASSSSLVALVTVSTTSASTVPYVIATTVSGLTLSNTQILKTTGTAAGVGAAAADITNDRIGGKWYPAP
mgnify:CR=1 FL=1